MKTLARPRDKAEVLQRLVHIRPDSARRWGRMSAHQMVCHLADAFRMALGDKGVRPVPGRMPAVVMRALALYVPMRWPPGIMTIPEIDQAIDGTCPGDFASDVADLIAMLEAFTADGAGPSCPEHPIFGAMSRRAWLRWGYLHMDHHLRQFGE